MSQYILSWVTECKLTGTLVSNQGKQRFTIAPHNVPCFDIINLRHSRWGILDYTTGIIQALEA